MKRMFIMALLTFALAIGLSACGTLVDNGTGLLFHTADPKLSIGFRLLPAPPLPTPDNPVVPPTATPECPNAKANINANDEHIYHCPGDANYNTVKIDKDGEAIYPSAAEAEAAGFRRALR